MTPVLSQVYLDDHGVAWVDGANVKVKEVALDWLADGLSPAEIHFQYPHISMAQIHAALAYYFEHQSEIEAEIEQDLREVDEIRSRTPPSPFVARMRAEGRLP